MVCEIRPCSPLSKVTAKMEIEIKTVDTFLLVDQLNKALAKPIQFISLACVRAPIVE